MRSTAPSTKVVDKNPVRIDHMHVEKDISYFGAKGKGCADASLKTDVNRGVVNCDKGDGRELRISCNSNLIMDDGVNESQLEGVIILNYKLRRRVEDNAMNVGNTFGSNSNTIELGHANPKNMYIVGTGFQTRQEL